MHEVVKEKSGGEHSRHLKYQRLFREISTFDTRECSPPLFCVCSFGDRVLYRSGWSQTPYVGEDDFELLELQACATMSDLKFIFLINLRGMP